MTNTRVGPLQCRFQAYFYRTFIIVVLFTFKSFLEWRVKLLMNWTYLEKRGFEKKENFFFKPITVVHEFYGKNRRRENFL